MNPSHVRILVEMEARRRYRSFVSDTRRVAVLAIVGVVFLLPVGLMTFGAYALGGAIAAGDVDVPLWVVRAAGGGGVLALAIMATFRAIQTAAVPVNADGVLTMAAHREVVASIVVLELIATGGIVGAFGLLAAVAFGAGMGSIAAATGIVAGVATIILLGTTLGLALGFGVRIAIARSELLARYKTAIGALLFVAYFLAITASGDEASTSVFELVGRAVGSTPLGWLGDLALLGADVGANPTLAAGGIVLALGGGLVGAALVDRLADRLWYETAVEGTRDEPVSDGMDDLPVVPRPVGRVARKAWLRAWRSPIRLLFVVYPLFLLVEPLSSAIQTGTIPAYLPATLALYGAWATGAAFTLNPIGDETDVLPLTLTTPISGRTFMLGCCLAGVAIGVPLTTILVAGSAIAAGLEPLGIGTAAILGVLLPTGAAILATGVGTAFPRLEAVNVTRGRKAVVPSIVGFGVYSLALTILASPVLLVQVPTARDLLVDATGLGAAGVTAAGIGLTLLLLGGAAFVSLSSASRTFDEFCPP